MTSSYARRPDAERSTTNPVSQNWLAITIVLVAIGAIAAVRGEPASLIDMLGKAPTACRGNGGSAGGPDRIGKPSAQGVAIRRLARKVLSGQCWGELFR
jgi:hypothetical protein